eukprot:gene11011-14788_t
MINFQSFGIYLALTLVIVRSNSMLPNNNHWIPSKGSYRMSDFVPNIDKYFQRIKYSPVHPTPNLETLQNIHLLHSFSIPFENINILLRQPIHTNPSQVEEKIVSGVRGGYCFEQNNLLLYILRSLGYNVKPLMARVRWNRLSNEISTGLTHLVLMVNLDEKSYLVDVGFGSFGTTHPLDIHFEGEQTTNFEPHRILKLPQEDGQVGYMHQVFVEDKWADMYYFELLETLPVDWMQASWYTETHPDSIFTQNLIVSQHCQDDRYTILNREFTIRHRDGTKTSRIIENHQDLINILQEYFGMSFPVDVVFHYPPQMIW